MKLERELLNPAWLPAGTRVGPWRVLERRGRGTYGAVYRAESAEAPSGPVALKLAVYPRDERFDREEALLSRIHHPGVTRFIDSGDWRQVGGGSHPYLVMEFIEGAPLYDWARTQRVSSRQVLRALASLARALEATHAVDGVHRDVKGSNVLVRAEDGQVFLTDFGSGHYAGASTLTWQALPPGTPAYRSPEAWRFIVRYSGENPAVPYLARPSDDVFSLGVTAYRLVTEQYPPSTDPADEESRFWHQEGAEPRSPRALNPRCCPELSALVLRMLDVRPEARGSARELAEALEQAAASAGPEADVPLFTQAVRWFDDLVITAPARRPVPQAHEQAWKPRRAAVRVGVPLALGIGVALCVRPGERLAEAPSVSLLESVDGGTVAVGDSALTAPVASVRGPTVWSPIALGMPPKPFPGQIRPDARGRCPGKVQVPINGGCWVPVRAELTACNESGYVYKGECYLPAYPPERVPTASPAGSSP